jgi:hypothetical protein
MAGRQLSQSLGGCVAAVRVEGRESYLLGFERIGNMDTRIPNLKRRGMEGRVDKACGYMF